MKRNHFYVFLFISLKCSPLNPSNAHFVKNCSEDNQTDWFITFLTFKFCAERRKCFLKSLHLFVCANDRLLISFHQTVTGCHCSCLTEILIKILWNHCHILDLHQTKIENEPLANLCIIRLCQKVQWYFYPLSLCFHKTVKLWVCHKTILTLTNCSLSKVWHPAPIHHTRGLVC